MFWSFYNLVHKLPMPEDRNDPTKWWTPEEQQKLDFINHQLSYNRIGDDPKFPTLVASLGIGWTDEQYSNLKCIGPSLVVQDDQLVLGLDQKWVDFLTEHLELGSYVGAVTFHKEDEYGPLGGAFTCYKCGSKYMASHPEPAYNSNEYDNWYEQLQTDGYDMDCEGVGKLFEGTIYQQAEGTAPCPCCGEPCQPVRYDEGPDVDTLWVFQQGSVGYCHYGRGAGMSVRLHTNAGVPEGTDPIKYFQSLK
jgi:hypothetical protein